MLLGTGISFVLPSSLQSSSSVRFSGSCYSTSTYSYEMQLKLWIMFPQENNPILSFPLFSTAEGLYPPDLLDCGTCFTFMDNLFTPCLYVASPPSPWCPDVSWAHWAMVSLPLNSQSRSTAAISVLATCLVCLFLVSMFSDMALEYVSICITSFYKVLYPGSSALQQPKYLSRKPGMLENWMPEIRPVPHTSIFLNSPQLSTQLFLD